MQKSEPQPRNPVGLVAIALLLGAPTLMLWMGRFKLAVLYLLAGLALLALLFAAAYVGFPPASFLASLGIDSVAATGSLPVAAAALFHAFRLNNQPQQRPWYARWYIALPAVFVVMLPPAFAVRSFLLHPFQSPTASMMPALLIGDHFFISKTAYRAHPPERGDIAVFKLPSDPSIVYVKRVIGLPGERIQMIDGVLHINDGAVKMERTEIAPAYQDILMQEMPQGELRYFQETLPNGRSHIIIDLYQGDADNTGVYEVPPGHFFVMGDNRDNTADSRFEQTGFIPAENFIGPFSFRFFNDRGTPLIDRPSAD